MIFNVLDDFSARVDGSHLNIKVLAWFFYKKFLKKCAWLRLIIRKGRSWCEKALWEGSGRLSTCTKWNSVNLPFFKYSIINNGGKHCIGGSKGHYKVFDSHRAPQSKQQDNLDLHGISIQFGFQDTYSMIATMARIQTSWKWRLCICSSSSSRFRSHHGNESTLKVSKHLMQSRKVLIKLFWTGIKDPGEKIPTHSPTMTTMSNFLVLCFQKTSFRQLRIWRLLDHPRK